MKVFGRRIFAKRAPLAVASMTIVGRDAMNRPISDTAVRAPAPDLYPYKPGVLEGTSTLKEVFDPFAAPRRAFFELRSAYISKRRIRNIYSQTYIPPDIDALKSVSHQHKLRMAIKYAEQAEKEDESFLDMIASMVGYKRKEDRVYGPERTEAGNY